MKIYSNEVIKISDIEQTLHFTEYDFLQVFSKSFPSIELSRIYELLQIKQGRGTCESTTMSSLNIAHRIHPELLISVSFRLLLIILSYYSLYF